MRDGKIEKLGKENQRNKKLMAYRGNDGSWSSSSRGNEG